MSTCNKYNNNMIKICIVITFISIHVNTLNMYIKLKLRFKYVLDSLTTLYLPTLILLICTLNLRRSC